MTFGGPSSGSTNETLKFVFAREAIDALSGRTLNTCRDGFERVLLALHVVPS